MTEISITAAEARVYRAPLETPVQTSFGLMRDRPMVVLVLRTAEGITGLGEVWCNFPAVGADYKAQLFNTVLMPPLCEQPFESPTAAHAALEAQVAVLQIQCGEPGPFANLLAAIDQALCDIAAQQAGVPLWQYLGGAAHASEVPVYASGLNPTAPEKLAAERRAEGYGAFKLKIGFGTDRDRANLDALRDLLGPDAPLMVDANQAWRPAEAHAALQWLAPYGLTWLEEPLRADRPAADWASLAGASPIPLAAGENMLQRAEFDAATTGEVLGVIQPDLAKWGGPTQCIDVGRQVIAAGKSYCPHYLGGGIGLLASAHVLAAAGGPGMLEIDANPNPLRTVLMDRFIIGNGTLHLADTPGLGISEAALEQLAKWRTDG